MTISDALGMHSHGMSINKILTHFFNGFEKNAKEGKKRLRKRRALAGRKALKPRRERKILAKIDLLRCSKNAFPRVDVVSCRK